MSDNCREAGLHKKFVVERVDGRDKPGGDRAGARYIVLDVVHDDAAKRAALAYADALQATHPELAGDIRDLVFRVSLKWPLPETEQERLGRKLAEAWRQYLAKASASPRRTNECEAFDGAALADHIIADKEKRP